MTNFHTRSLIIFGLVFLLGGIQAFGNSNQIQSNIILESPHVTNWGSWGKMDLCPEGTYASGMQLKVEPFLDSGDDTALNGIRLLCLKPGENNFDTAISITSSYGDFGNWLKEFYCDHGVIVGFQLNSEAYQDSGDDTAANNLRIFCSNLNGAFLQGDGYDWGKWTEKQMCLSKQTVCGIQTQLEQYIEDRDDTSLNNVRMKCCEVSNMGEKCNPKDEWEIILECDNSKGIEPMSCMYQKTRGVSKSSYASESMIQEHSLMFDLGWTTSAMYSGLSANFRYNLSYSETTQYSWTKESSETFNEATTITASFQVPGGMTSKLSQAVGNCGFFSVFSNYFKKEDFNGNECSVQFITY